MSQIERCRNCRGQKQVVGMGGLPKKCTNCQGIGYVEKVTNQDVDEFLNQPKKRGRKRMESQDGEE